MKRIISNRSVIGVVLGALAMMASHHLGSGWGFAASIVAGFVAADLDARGGYNA